MSDSVTQWTIARQAPLSMRFFQARILEWAVISFSRGSSQPRDWTRGLLHCRQTLYRLSHQGRFQRDKHKTLLEKKKKRGGTLRGLGGKSAVNRSVETDGHQWPRAALPNRHVHKAPLEAAPALPASQPGATGKRKTTHAFLISFPRISCESWGSQDVGDREPSKSWPPLCFYPLCQLDVFFLVSWTSSQPWWSRPLKCWCPKIP